MMIITLTTRFLCWNSLFFKVSLVEYFKIFIDIFKSHWNGKIETYTSCFLKEQTLQEMVGIIFLDKLTRLIEVFKSSKKFLNFKPFGTFFVI